MPDDDAASGPPEATARPQTFTRDLEDTRQALEAWLAARRPDAARIRIPELNIPATNGMSTETLLFDAVFDEDGTERTEPLVARVAPDPVNVPVFREYDLEGQFQIMRQVALHTVGARPPRALARARLQRARRALLRDGAALRHRAARPHAVPVRRQLALRRAARAAGGAPEPHRSR